MPLSRMSRGYKRFNDNRLQPKETSVGNGNDKSKTTKKTVVAGLEVIEAEYRVDKPVYKDKEVDVPVYKEVPVEVPVGLDKALIKMAERISNEVLARVTEYLNQKLDKAIDERISKITVPQIVYKKEEKIVEVEKVSYKEVEVKKPKFVDKEVINPVLKDKEVINAKIKDVEVLNAILQDRVVIQPKFEEVVIKRPKYIDKDIVVIHPKYIDMKGNPENE